MSESLFRRSVNNWNRAMGRSFFTIHLLFTLIILLILGIVVPYFFEYVQNRPGIRINDWVLDLLPSEDVSLIIFPIVYLSLIITILHLSFYPEFLLRAMQAYILMTLLRITTIYFFNLEPPLGIVELNDPFVSYFFYSEQLIDKDLFFSGHTATMTLLVLASRSRYLKMCLLFTTFLIASLVLIQHVHYTIDVLAAPLFASISYYTVKSLFKYSK